MEVGVRQCIGPATLVGTSNAYRQNGEIQSTATQHLLKEAKNPALAKLPEKL